MNSALLMEPDLSGKRRRFARTLIEAKGAPRQESVEDLAARIREVRDHSLARLDALVDELTSKLAGVPGVELSFAKDSEQAVEIVEEISDGTPVAISKSAVVGKELKPGLEAAGVPIIETYFQQFEPFENRFEHFWQLPQIEAEAVIGSFGKATDLVGLRESSLKRQGCKRLTGLLGVNAISAQDGGVVLFQHMHNIRDIFTQAEKLVLVAGLDKIVADLDAAVLQTKCMAVFGWGLVPLSIRGGAGRKDSGENLPFQAPDEQRAGKVHLILLDNGRSGLLGTPYEDLLACIGCRACSKDCPSFPFFEAGAGWSPKEYLYFHVTGKRPAPDLCLQCRACEYNCPLSIDLPGMIVEARIAVMAKEGRLTDKTLANIEALGKLGSSMPDVAGVAADSRALRWMAERVAGVSKERELPRFQRTTFEKWFRSGRGKT
jgi:L-lactate dehydrogenase complex protein LldF